MTNVSPLASPRRVLVVDDHEPTAVGLSRLIRVLGHDVHIAPNGQAALDSLDAFRPDLILLDLGLPHMDGYEVVRLLRAHPVSRTVTIVALTGYGGSTDRLRVREAGFDHHLVKPAQFKAVAALLDPSSDAQQLQ